MALETTLWDPAEFLTTPERIAAYLEVTFDEGDPALVAKALGDVARARGMTQLAQEGGVPREARDEALMLDDDPRLSTFLGVIKALGLKITAKAA